MGEFETAEENGRMLFKFYQRMKGWMDTIICQVCHASILPLRQGVDLNDCLGKRCHVITTVLQIVKFLCIGFVFRTDTCAALN